MSHYHLTRDERLQIESLLRQNRSIRSIALALNRSPSTVSREIARHLVFRKTGAFGKPFNDCVHRIHCHYSDLCNKAPCTFSKCNQCAHCHKVCSDYQKQVCDRIEQKLCNGCERLRRCTLEKRLYDARAAHKEYLLILATFREGIRLNEVEFTNARDFVHQRVPKGHSFYTIASTARDQLMLSERSLYRYQDAGLFGLSNIELPLKVRLRPRKKARPFKVDKGCRIGRTFQDYQGFMEANPDVPVVEMDSVIGQIGGKVLLTLTLRSTGLFLAFLRERNTSASVTDVFKALYVTLGHDAFIRLFQLLLTDNGSEFSNPLAIEWTPDGRRRSHVFYCDPMAAYQKPAIENAHVLLRRILPKGTSFDDLTQETVQRVVDHLNSYPRKNLGGFTPAEVFRKLYGDDLLTLLGVQTLPIEKVVLKPSLLK